MVEDSDRGDERQEDRKAYASRLNTAMGVRSVADLAAALKITYTGAKKVVDAKSIFTAKNNTIAAGFLGVDSDWLAAGIGEMRSTRVWPFQRVSPEQWFKASETLRKAAEDIVLADASRFMERALTPPDDGKTPPANHGAFHAKVQSDYDKNIRPKTSKKQKSVDEAGVVPAAPHPPRGEK